MALYQFNNNGLHPVADTSLAREPATRNCFSNVGRPESARDFGSRMPPV